MVAVKTWVSSFVCLIGAATCAGVYARSDSALALAFTVFTAGVFLTLLGLVLVDEFREVLLALLHELRP